MHRFRGKSYVMPLDRCAAEEIVEKNAAVALQVTMGRNESGHPGVFQIDLYKFSVFQKAVHPGNVFCGRIAGAGRGNSGRVLPWFLSCAYDSHPENTHRDFADQAHECSVYTI